MVDQERSETPELDEVELERLADQLARAYQAAGELVPEELARQVEGTAEDSEPTATEPGDLEQLVEALAAAEAQRQVADEPEERDGQTPPEPDLVQVVEAFLFVGGEGLKPERLAELLGSVTPGEVKWAVETLSERYDQQRRPYRVVQTQRGYVLQLRPAFERLVGAHVRRPKAVRLSQAAIDVLAVVAYRQPVSLREIDAMRGVESAGVVRQLVRRGLIRPVAGSENRGKRTLYETTGQFLRVFRLSSLADLPRIDLAEAQELPPPPHRSPLCRGTAKAESSSRQGPGRHGRPRASHVADA